MESPPRPGTGAAGTSKPSKSPAAGSDLTNKNVAATSKQKQKAGNPSSSSSTSRPASPTPVRTTPVTQDYDESNNKERIDKDFVSLLVHSGVKVGHQEYLLVNTPRGIGMMGCEVIDGKETWKAAAMNLVNQLDSGPESISLEGILRIDRWPVPGNTRFASHVVFTARVPPDQKSYALEKLRNSFWMHMRDIYNMHGQNKLISCELNDMITQFEKPSKLASVGHEVLPSEILFCIEADKDNWTSLDLLIHSAQLGKNEQELLYKEFLRLTLPYHTMGFTCFSRIMKSLGWTDADIPNLFRVFDSETKGGILFRELLGGIAALEPNTQHGGPPAEVRCRYIFRFFDKDKDGRLDFAEFKNLVASIRLTKGLTIDDESVEAEAKESAMVFGQTTEESVGPYEFLQAVGTLKFRGTSHLLRSPKSVITLLQNKPEQITFSFKKPGAPPVPVVERQSQELVLPADSHKKEATRNALPSYDVATHCVRVKKSGTILDITSLCDVEHSGVSKEAHDRTLVGAGTNRQKSVESFNQKAGYNEMLNGLKYFEKYFPMGARGNSMPKLSYDWGEIEKASLAECFISICHQAKKIFMAEPRLVELSSPVYVLGDIHGNFPDLMCFEKAFWRFGMAFTPATFLFLGDFVDRGQYSVEVIAYLLAQKVAAPKKLILLRGNHELRDVQQMFTFFNECLVKFGPSSGNVVWAAVNDVFDCMPYAATIDKKVFCAHGGIVPPWIGNGLISAINEIPVPLSRPEETSPLAWELMWSDPIHENLSPEDLEPYKLKDGYGVNLRRGTGHVYTQTALDGFLERNHLSHVIRAHEVQQAGFKVQLGGKLLTVFSSSKYCGGSNEAACILADKFKLRTIRLDTKEE